MKSGAKSGRFVKGFVAGALLGTAVGLLVAPQPGRQTRNLIRRKTGDLRGRFRRSSAVNGTANHTETHAEISS